ncbi:MULTISPECIES: WXG100 family type VII secretion target [Streptomyces]|uniref:WXG100 family type VII secretion target n=3 Tax=Streptomyces avermitilis TaxID=33903 RepID=Q82K71_STRAW|nr:MULTISPECIES: WXG100 family type VII secretion target [Streptomyces]KUN49995.1 hypothetical protein AQJ43_35165 [Streptomyces avermitilis]MYS98139.1 hypothetical protein [Streptomyces sp. SID5469]OOV33439.1 hypothetical protein SM007_12095 [Streptomyces avermitilis]BAC70244.1 hypothetical protein SAVERM_2533 [Streptomyces avermitilis MA-4680 = NBRC 14893]BBJ50332.1 hypothetical protein SAVMC3_29610 [Streptomyces avermitilis]
MATNGMKVNNDPVIKLEQDMYTKFEAIRARVHKLQGVIDGLEGQWQGIGRAAFDKKQYEINQSLGALGGILTEVIEGVNKTRKITDGSEDEVRAAVQKIDLQDGAPTVTASAFNNY